MGRRLNNYSQEQIKFLNKINWRIRELVKQGKVSEDEMIETLSDIEGVEIVERTNAFTISRATNLTADVIKTLETYINTPKKFNYDKSNFKYSLKVTKDDFYEFMESKEIKKAIEDIKRQLMIEKDEDAEKILGLDKVRDYMSDWGRAYRDGDKERIMDLKSDIESEIMYNQMKYNTIPLTTQGD